MVYIQGSPVSTDTAGGGRVHWCPVGMKVMAPYWAFSNTDRGGGKVMVPCYSLARVDI